MLRKPVSAVALLLMLAVAVSAIAQTMTGDAQPAVSSAQSIPIRGMTMEYVEANYGSPANKRAPIGDPPITRWEYEQFIVYFEYKRVIHSVAKRPTAH